MNMFFLANLAGSHFLKRCLSFFFFNLCLQPSFSSHQEGEPAMNTTKNEFQLMFSTNLWCLHFSYNFFQVDFIQSTLLPPKVCPLYFSYNCYMLYEEEFLNKCLQTHFKEIHELQKTMLAWLIFKKIHNLISKEKLIQIKTRTLNQPSSLSDLSNTKL